MRAVVEAGAREVRHIRHDADADDHVVAQHAPLRGLHHEGAAVEIDLQHPLAKADIGIVLRRPFQVIAEFKPRNLIETRVEKLQQSAMLMQIGHKRESIGGIGQRDQILEQGNLQPRAWNHHAVMPGERRFLLEENALDVMLTMQERGHAEIGWPAADADAVIFHDVLALEVYLQDKRSRDEPRIAAAEKPTDTLIRNEQQPQNRQSIAEAGPVPAPA